MPRTASDSHPFSLAHVTTNQTFNLVLGFILTAIVGGALTHYYAQRQLDLEARRSFADALNRERVERIAEVWEKLYVYEAAVDRALDARERVLEVYSRIAETVPTIQAGDNDTSFHMTKEQQVAVKVVSDPAIRLRVEAERAAVDVQTTALKNRFWVGDKRYAEIVQYLKESGATVTLGGTQLRLAALRAGRKRLKVSIAEIRDSVTNE